MNSSVKAILHGVAIAAFRLVVLSMAAIWVMFMGGIDLTIYSPVSVIVLSLAGGIYLVLKEKRIEMLYPYVIWCCVTVLAAFFLPVFVFLTVVPALMYDGHASVRRSGADSLPQRLAIGGLVGLGSMIIVVMMFGATIKEIDSSRAFVVELVAAGVLSSLFGAYMAQGTRNGKQEN